MSSYRGTISPDEIRGREILRKAVEEAREEERRKHKLLEGQVQEGTDKFLHGTDGIHHAGVKIDVEKRHIRSIVDKYKRIQTMKALGLDGGVIEHAERELERDRTILLAASFRGPKRLVIEEHREDREKKGSFLDKIVERLKSKKKEKTVEVEVLEE